MVKITKDHGLAAEMAESEHAIGGNKITLTQAAKELFGDAVQEVALMATDAVRYVKNCLKGLGR